MRHKLLFIVVVLCLVTFMGCSDHRQDFDDGVFIMDVQGDPTTIPKLHLNGEDDTFTLAVDVMSSYLGQGSYEVFNNTITATTQDKANTFIFDMLDENTISFDIERSTVTENPSFIFEEEAVFIRTVT